MPKVSKEKKRFTYVEPTPEEVTSLQKKSVVENTHRSTLNWTKQFENYRKDTNLPGELSDISNPKQLEKELCKYFTYFNGETSKLKLIDLNDKKAHPDLWQDFKTVEVWYEKTHLGRNSMKAFFKRLVVSCNIDISGQLRYKALDKAINYEKVN
ncbi:6600_t:CDS:2, partial [Dentiscutata erythropus]